MPGDQLAISVKSLTKTFGAKTALNNASFDVQKGSIFGFLGPNGAGKTTAIRCIMNFIRPTSGTIEILGKDAQQDSTELKESIGYLSSDYQLNQSWTGAEHINFFESIKGKNQNTAKIIDRLDLDTSARVQSLSSGNKQKLAILLSFVGDPQILIMDEPTRGLDPLLQNELYAMLEEFKDNNRTVFFSSHNLNEVERICDAVVLIKDGEIVEEKEMSDIHNLRVHIITASSDKKINPALLHKLPNTEVVSSNHRTVTLKVRGDINPALQVLSRFHLTDVSINHASLEDTFLEMYR